MARFKREVVLLKSDEFASVPEVWETRRYMSGIHGAPCTVEMKVAPRLAFQKPDDRHVFGYTADTSDINRFNRLRSAYPELEVRAPLIDAGVTKQAALSIVRRWGVALPRSYAMGFPNANCLGSGCVKATSPAYWSLYRQRFPAQFAHTAALSRKLGARLARLQGERVFIDEIPLDHPTTDPIAPSCDFLCHLAEQEIGAA